MTTTQKVAVGVVTVVVVAVTLWKLFGSSDEQGIRVKNGSAIIETLSGAGFVAVGQDFESKGNVRRCFLLAVTTTLSCENNITQLDEVVQVTFTTRDDVEHVIQIQGRKFKTRLRGSWALKQNDTVIEYGDPRQSLKTVTARGQGAGRLSCTFGETANGNRFLLDNVNTSC